MSHTFCCCVRLKTGCIVIAIIKLIASFWTYFLLGFPYPTVIPLHIVYVVFVYPGFILHNIFGIISGSCLLAGAIKKHKNGYVIITYMVMDMINIALGIFFVIVTCICLRVWDSKHPRYATVLGTCFGIYVCLSIYFWICVYRFYKEERSRPHTYPKVEFHEPTFKLKYFHARNMLEK